MIVAIHQPHFIPWLGYLHRMAQADLFILLDHVQFERRNYQNRCQIRLDGEARWLTVPVEQHSQKERIVDKQIDNREAGRHWARNHLATLRHAYREAPYLPVYLAELRRLFESPWQRLVDLDLAMLQFLRATFRIDTRLARSSDLGVDGAKSELILNLCRAVGADALLAGFGGSRGYLDAEAFARHGIAIRYHEFTHPTYRQCGPQPFIPGLAAVDLLFNAGPQSGALLRGEHLRPEPAAAAP
ncbi:MAG TPA: WbqC family protein [Burkholderiales bacterium]|nr:WbqC family protein [Burkholderiales bacterium]